MGFGDLPPCCKKTGSLTLGAEPAPRALAHWHDQHQLLVRQRGPLGRRGDLGGLSGALIFL